ncbi:MAG: DUF3833 family protein [Erythrobacter sp.]|uniref:DUF3833 family protein n=1 Tax=Erythrobacter sp. TaxID=1042 RepID=UPI003C766C20
MIAAHKKSRLVAGLALALAALPGCASLPDDGFAMIPRADAPDFDPLHFFEGRLEGRGILDKGVLGTVPVRVESVGERSPLGVLVLTQTIYEGDEPPRTRIWEFAEVGGRTYEGRMTDALGPVAGWSSGNMLTLNYIMDGNYEVIQRMTLAPDGTRATNATRVELLGATIAVLSEEIVRVK